MTELLPSKRIERFVRIACVLALVALALIAFALLFPIPLAVVVAMSVAQGIGTFSLLLFLGAIGLDLRRVLQHQKKVAKVVEPPAKASVT